MAWTSWSWISSRTAAWLGEVKLAASSSARLTALVAGLWEARATSRPAARWPAPGGVAGLRSGAGRRAVESRRRRASRRVGEVVEALVGGEINFLEDIGAGDTGAKAGVEAEVEPALEAVMVLREEFGEGFTITVSAVVSQ